MKLCFLALKMIRFWPVTETAGVNTGALAASEVRTTLSVGPNASETGAMLYFGDFGAKLYAIDTASPYLEKTFFTLKMKTPCL